MVHFKLLLDDLVLKDRLRLPWKTCIFNPRDYRPVGAPPARPDTELEYHSSDVNTEKGICTAGSVMYQVGAAMPGDTACDNCTCSADGRPRCSRVRCEPRPGCKALHRPDHCCPTYQCECEQDGRRYGNGEKLVDPDDPCRVCYCQGGEVVCRRIACFRRDDCRPRHVPGRCCPEYDHCPLRGISTVPGSAAMLNVTPVETAGGAAPDPVKQEITIKEITPVSEIPVITEVKIKEVLPTPKAEGAEPGSSRAPSPPREVASPAPGLEAHGGLTDDDPTRLLVTDDASPSKASSTITSSDGGGASGDKPAPASAQSASALEDDDPSLFEHSPAFPPLPDDLSVLTEREDEIAVDHPTSDTPRGTPVSLAPASTAVPVASAEDQLDEHEAVDASVPSTSVKDDAPAESRSATGTEASEDHGTTTAEISGTTVKPAEATRDGTVGRAPHRARPLHAATSVPTTDVDRTTAVSTESPSRDTTIRLVETSRDVPDSPTDSRRPPVTTVESASKETPATPEQKVFTDVSTITDSSAVTDVPTGANVPAVTTSQSNLTPIFSQTDAVSTKLANPSSTRSSVAVDTPVEVDQDSESTEATSLDDSDGTETATSSEITTEDGANEASSRGTAAPPRLNKNVLADLIDLVDDVASIGERNDGPRPPAAVSSAPSASAATAESEEFIPVNSGFKSKNSNWNPNSITEGPDKVPRRPIAVELEEDEPEEDATDSPRLGDRAEPTTRPPLIDRVTAGAQPAGARHDIEIITQAYVPGIARRPTKVVLGEPVGEAAPDPAPAPSTASEPAAH